MADVDERVDQEQRARLDNTVFFGAGALVVAILQSVLINRWVPAVDLNREVATVG